MGERGRGSKMAAVEDEVEERYQDIDIETLLSRVQRRPLTFSRSKSVYIAPEFTQRLKGEETVDEGSDLTLTFKVTGLPQPTLRWFKDDEEVADHPRLTVEEKGDGGYRLTLHQVNKGDEAAYRCRAENSEGSSSCCFFLTVKGKPKSPKREHSGKGHKRTVSFPTMFSTIVEKVEEEEKCGRETAQAPESPLTHFYTSLTLPERQTWPSFLGDWAFVNGRHKTRGGSAPPEDRRDPKARDSKGTPDTLRTRRAVSPMTYSLIQQKEERTAPWKVRHRTWSFVARKESKGPSESELYRQMLLAHRRKLRHVERPEHFLR